MSTSYRSPALGATFRQFLNGFLQMDGLPFRDVERCLDRIEEIRARRGGSAG